ncbi:unnamed protein product, partial [Iphiclides podalirius]
MLCSPPAYRSPRHVADGRITISRARNAKSVVITLSSRESHQPPPGLIFAPREASHSSARWSVFAWSSGALEPWSPGAADSHDCDFRRDSSPLPSQFPSALRTPASCNGESTLNEIITLTAMG